MVKTLDDTTLLIEHIGVDLWRAATAWRDTLNAAMVKRGHSWYGDARGAIGAHLEPNGLSQSALTLRMGMTKQAVQQLLDGLEGDGIVRREPDPEDRRGKRVVYTEKGRQALRDAVQIKRAIERAYRARLGRQGFEEFTALLRKLAAPLPTPASGRTTE